MSTNALVVIASALKVRMTTVVRDCAWFAMRRYGGDRPNRLYFDVPMARFALLRAEKNVLLDGTSPRVVPPVGLPSEIEDLRSEAMAAVTLDGGTGRRDDPNAPPDLKLLVDLTAQPPVERVLTVADIIAFLEVDSQTNANAVFFRRI
jgi:hypothetical protein